MPASYNFALEAQRLLGSGQAGEAVTLCEQGLTVYPDYQTAYAILARAYLQMSDIESAFHTVQRGLKLFPLNKALKMLDDDLRPLAATHPLHHVHHVQTAQSDEPPLQPDEPVPLTAPTPEQHDTPPDDVDEHALAVESEEAGTSVEPVESDEPHDVIEPLEVVEPVEMNKPHNVIEPLEVVEPAESDEPQEPLNDDNAAEPTANEIPSEEPFDELLDDALSNIGDDEDIAPDYSEFLKDEADDVEAERLMETPEAQRDILPDILLTDALSNIDDDNENWLGATELAHDVIEEQVMNSYGEGSEHAAGFEAEKIVSAAVPAAPPLRKHEPQLRLIETAKIDERAMRTLRSSNLRLIPGLEYTPLRIEASRKQSSVAYRIAEPPPFPAIRGSRMQQPMMPPFAMGSSAMPLPDLEASLRSRMGEPSASVSGGTRKLSPLEELAARLERARIPAINEAPPPPAELSASEQQASIPHHHEPVMMSETMASIYERQGAYDQAVKAYQHLARIKPDRAEFYNSKVAELRQQME
ncbi:MAG: tetratricopeptide repeat protein [Candidatus Kapabacteria bacterium]|nr:tetratricopeptide repeat protein [Candidatus Kapabacteria bacterium]